MKPDIIEFLKKPLEVSPVWGYLIVTWSMMPFTARVLIISYIALWIVYSYMPWKYEQWNSKKNSLVSLQQKLRRAHTCLVFALLAFPIMLMGAYHLVEKSPDLLDHLNEARSDTAFASSPSYTLSVPVNSLPSTNGSTFIAILGSTPHVSQADMQIISAGPFFKITTRQLLYRLTQLFIGILVLAGIFVLIAIFVEPVAEGFAELNQVNNSP